MTIAITRRVTPDMSRCLLTCMEREPLDTAVASAQHDVYNERLAEMGAEVIELPAEPSCPDAVFVEDTAVVVDEVAVLTRPATESRRAELPSIEAALRKHRVIRRIEGPEATLEGGDVLRVGKRVFVGLSTRTNQAGIRSLAEHLGPHGYDVRAVRVTGCLHLKTAGTHIGDGVVLVNPAWCEAGDFEGVQLLHVDPAEPWAGNTVCLNGQVLMASGFERTRQLLEATGRRVLTAPGSELAKAEGGLTCCSLLLNRIE
ncbi:MAG: hypothetical protein KDA21_12975 [Phycisphaerales bacterium]|nr:hypothetical protein [Phycisphaerales bacterium]